MCTCVGVPSQNSFYYITCCISPAQELGCRRSDSPPWTPAAPACGELNIHSIIPCGNQDDVPIKCVLFRIHNVNSNVTYICIYKYYLYIYMYNHHSQSMVIIMSILDTLVPIPDQCSNARSSPESSLAATLGHSF